jgi:hypothetical protein
VSKVLREYEEETGEIVPTRGTVHDLGPSVTHKAEVLRRWLRHQSPVRIAQETKHSQASVDRYIADYQRVRLLVQKIPVEKLPALTSLSESVVEEYVELIKQYEPDLLVNHQASQKAGSREKQA